MTGGGLRCPAFVGRSDELAALAGAAHEAAAGRSGSVAIVGPAGIGKTRLVGEAVLQLARPGSPWLVARGGARVDRRDRSLHPLREALLTATRDLTPEEGEVPAFGAAVDLLLPTWRPGGRVDVGPLPPAVIGEAAFRLLRRIGEERPVALVLEDLHWADDDTLGAVGHLVAHLAGARLLVVVTARTDEPATPPGAAALLDGCDLAVELRPLDRDDVAAMARACLATDAVPEAVATRLLASGGLPLLVEDLVASTASEAPPRFSAIVEARLRSLDPSARAVIDAAALAGSAAGVELVAAATGRSASEVDRARASATSAQLLVPSEAPFTFRHALTADVVVATIEPGRRRVLSRALAAALDEQDDADRGVAARLWADGGEPEKAHAAFVEAARAASRHGSPELAVGLFEEALAVGPVDGSTRVALAEALLAAGRHREAVLAAMTTLDHAAARSVGVAARFVLADAHLAQGDADAAERQLGSLGELSLEPAERARLRVLEARVALAGGHEERARAAAHLAGQAVGLAEASGHDVVACEALELMSLCLRPSSLDAARRPLERMLALAEGASLPIWQVRALNELGALEALRDGVADRLLRARSAAMELGVPATVASVELNLAAVHAMRGEVDEAEAAAGRAEDLAGALGLVPLVAAATMLDGLAQGFRGDRAGLERRLRRAEELSPDDPDLATLAWAAGRGMAALLAEDRDEARRAFARADGFPTPARTLDPARGPRLLLLAVDGGPEHEVASQVAAALADGLLDARYPRFWLLAADAVVRGRAGDREGAATAAAEAARLGAPYRLFLAIARRLLAEAAIRDGWGEPVRWLQEAEAEFVGRSLASAASGCRALLRRAGVRTTRRRGADADVPAELLRLGITAREAEVLALVRERLTNVEIAGRLHLSVRTVEKHVANLLVKTGAENRRQLGGPLGP